MSRSKKNWDFLVDERGNYKSIAGFKGGKGLKGDKGAKGTETKGDKGSKGADGQKGEGRQILNFKGNVPNEAALGGIVGAVNGDVYLTEDTSELFVYVDGNWIVLNGVTAPLKGEKGQKGQKGEGDKGEKGNPAPLGEPAADDLMYGRTRGPGQSNGSWGRSVDLSGDAMTGPLSSPALTTGPTGDQSILYMDDGKDVYNGGAHELEPRAGASTDFGAWVVGTSPEKNNWFQVGAGNGSYVAASGQGSRTMYSDDGLNWTPKRTNTTADSNSWYSMTYGNGRFICASSSGIERFISSVDNGRTWQGGSWAGGRPEYATGSWYLAYGNGRFLAFNAYSTGNAIAYSDDGNYWNFRTESESNLLRSDRFRRLAYGADKWVAVGTASSTSRRIAYSSDNGLSWTHLTSPVNASWYDIAYGNDRFVVVGTSGSIIWSDDGLIWNQASCPNKSWSCIAYGDGYFVVMTSSDETIITSEDGVTWKEHKAPTRIGATSIAFGNQSFCAVGNYGSNRVLLLGVEPPTETGLFFDDELIYTNENASGVYKALAATANVAANTAEELEALFPTLIRDVWTHNNSTSPAAGNYTLLPSGNEFATATSIRINPDSKTQVSYSSELGSVKVGASIIVQNTDDPYGFAAKVTSTSYSSGYYTFGLTDVRAIDNNEPTISSRVGDAVIKIRSTNPEDYLDLNTFKTITAASTSFSDFQSRVAGL